MRCTCMWTGDRDLWTRTVPDPTCPAHRAPTVDELLGIDPDWTGPLATDEYLARTRGTPTCDCPVDHGDPEDDE